MAKRMVRNLVVLVLGVIGALGQGSNWKDYEYAKDGFAIASPSMPATEKLFADSDGGKIETHYYQIDVGPFRSLSISVSDFTRFGDLPAKKILQNGKRGAAEHKGPVTSEKEISLDGTAGLEYELGGADDHSWVRCYYVGGRLITVMSVAPAGLPFFPDTERFFNPDYS